MDHTSRPPQPIYFLVLKLPLLLGGYGALEVICHLCTAHQDLKKLPWLIEWIIRKQLFGLLSPQLWLIPARHACLMHPTHFRPIPAHSTWPPKNYHRLPGKA